MFIKSWTLSWILHKYWYSVPHIQLKLHFTSNFIRGPLYIGFVLLNFPLYSVEYKGTTWALTYQRLSTGLNKYPPKSNYSTIHDWGISKSKMPRRRNSQAQSRHQTAPKPPPPLHHSATPTMKRRRRAPLFNQPQNKNNLKKHHLLCVLFNVLAEHKCSRWLLSFPVVLFPFFQLLFWFALKECQLRQKWKET